MLTSDTSAKSAVTSRFATRGGSGGAGREVAAEGTVVVVAMSPMVTTCRAPAAVSSALNASSMSPGNSNTTDGAAHRRRLQGARAARTSAEVCSTSWVGAVR